MRVFFNLPVSFYVLNLLVDVLAKVYSLLASSVLRIVSESTMNPDQNKAITEDYWESFNFRMTKANLPNPAVDISATVHGMKEFYFERAGSEDESNLNLIIPAIDWLIGS